MAHFYMNRGRFPTSMDGLKDKVYEILSNIETEADLRNCFTESEATSDELGLSWLNGKI